MTRQGHETRLRQLEEVAGEEPWVAIPLQVVYVDAMDDSTELGPRYVVSIPAHQLKPQWRTGLASLLKEQEDACP